MHRAAENVSRKNFPFTDHSFDNSHNLLQFNCFEAYANEAALSRMHGCNHYCFGMEEGEKKGKKIGEMVNQFPVQKTIDAY